MNIDGRFKDAPWYEQSKNESILVGGVGGIGSNLMYNLTKTIPKAQYYIFDMDIVAEHNIGTQFFRLQDIDKSKVSALSDHILTFSKDIVIRCFNNKITDNSATLAITISAFDNMKARVDLFNAWKRLPDREIFIDGRLRASLYEVYVVTPGKEEEYEKTLFGDSDVDESPCTFKQTAYFAMLIGARITHVLVNYLINKYAKEDICNIPFKIQEVGEPFYINIT